MNKLGVGYLSYGFLAQKAEDFLLRYNPSGLIPIPIEEIVEFKLKVDIVPVPNLQKDFDIEGFTSSDLQNIFVDDYILSERPTRYRFTLAHEVGHIILHKEIFTKVKLTQRNHGSVFMKTSMTGKEVPSNSRDMPLGA